MTMNENELKKLYDALLGKGYSTDDLGDEKTFMGKMTDRNNRKMLYDWVSSRNDFRIGDYDAYESRLTSNIEPQQQPRQPAQESLPSMQPTGMQQQPAYQPGLREQVERQQAVVPPLRPQEQLPPMPSSPWSGQQEGKDLTAYNLEAQEDARIRRENNIPSEPAGSEDAIFTKYRDMFSLTERGKQLGAELGEIERGVFEKYVNEFKGTDEYKTLAKKKYASQEEADREVNGKFLERYGTAIEDEMRPYHAAYQKELDERYGGQVSREVMQLRKKEFVPKLDAQIKSVDGMIEKLEDEGKTQGRGAPTLMTFSSAWQENTDRDKARQRRDKALLREAKDWLGETKGLVDAAVNHSGFWRGIANTAIDPDNWSFGFGDLIRNVHLKEALEKSERGEKLSDGEEQMLRAAVINMAANAYYRSDLGTLYKMGETTGVSLPFMLEFAVNPISSSGSAVAKSLLKYGMKKFGKAAMKKGISKFTARLAGDMLAAGEMSLTTGLPGVVADTQERLNRNYEYGVDENGELVVKKTGDTGVGEALGKSLASRTIENQSEMVFNAFKGLGRKVFGAIEKHLPGGVNRFMSTVKNSGVGRLYRDIAGNPTLREAMKRTQFHGIGEEYLEEVYNNFANIPLGDMTLEEATDLDNNIDTFLGLAPTSIAFGMIGLGGMAREKRRMNRNLEELRGMMGDQEREVFDEWMKSLNEKSKDELRKKVKSLILNKDITPEMKKDILHGVYLIEQGRTLQDIRGEQTETERAVDDAYEEGMGTPPEEQHRVNADVESAMQELFDANEAIGNTVQDMSQSDATVADLEEELKRLGATEEESRLARNAFLANARAAGVVDSAQEETDAAVEAYAEKMKSFVVEQEDGSRTVTTAWMTDSRGNRSQVYVMDDGSALGAGMAIVMDETGQKMTVDPKSLSDAESRTYDDMVGQYRQQTMEQARQLTEWALNHNKNTKMPGPGMVFTTGDNSFMMITGQVGDSWQVLPAQFDPKTGQYVPVASTQGTTMSTDEVLKAQDDYYDAVEENERGTAQGQETESVKPTGRGVFGNIYGQFRGKAKEAVAFLRRLKSGEAVGALHHKDIGDISLVWGDEKAGLAHILGRHPEIADDLQGILDGMHVVQQSDNRIVLESDTHKAVVSRKKGNQSVPEWLLTAYEKKEKSVSASSSDIETEPKGKGNGTAAPQGGLSTGKGSEKSGNSNESEGKNQELSALDRIPKDEKGNPVYEQTDPGTAWDAIMEQTEGDEDMAKTVVTGMIADKEKELKKVEQSKSGGGVSVAEKIASEKKRKAAIDNARGQLEIWQKIANVPLLRRADADAERRKQEAEAAARRKAEEERVRAEREEDADRGGGTERDSEEGSSANGGVGLRNANQDRVERAAYEGQGSLSQPEIEVGLGEQEYTLSEKKSGNGEAFYQDKDGNIDLASIPDEVFEQIGYTKAPFRLTPSMMTHMINSHGKELGISSVDEAVKFVLDVINNFDHVRLGYDGALIFSIENGRNRTGKRAITILINSDNGQFYGLKSSGYEAIAGLNKRPLLWERGAKDSSSTTDAASANVSTGKSSISGEQSGSASNQSNNLSNKNGIVWPVPTVGSNVSTDNAEVVDSPAKAAEGEAVDRGGDSSQTTVSSAKVSEKTENSKESRKEYEKEKDEMRRSVNTSSTEAQKKAEKKKEKNEKKPNVGNNSLNSPSNQNAEKNGTLPESVPQGERRTEAPQNGRMEEAADRLRERSRANEEAHGRSGETLSLQEKLEEPAQDSGKNVSLKPWSEMNAEERMAEAEKQPLTREEIETAPSDEVMKTNAMSYLDGDHGFIPSISYLKVYGDVRHSNGNPAADSGTANGAQLDETHTGSQQGLDGTTGATRGVSSELLDREQGEGTVSGVGGQLQYSPDSEERNVAGTREGSDIDVPGEEQRVGGLPVRGGERGRGGNGGSHGRDGKRGRTEGSKQGPGNDRKRGTETKRGGNRRDGGSQSIGADLDAALADALKEFDAVLDEFKRAGKEELSISLTGMNSRQMEMLPRLVSSGAKVGYVFIKKGVYTFAEWARQMLDAIGSKLRSLGLGDNEVDAFIREMWKCKLTMDGETHTIEEWASMLGKSELREKISETYEEKLKAQREAESVAVKTGDLQNIAETLPFLLPQQQEDVLKAETQFFDESHNDRDHAFGKGYMFTNGTGTGKTYTGLGIVKRFIKQGKGRILILTPSQTKVKDWVKDASNLGIKLNNLDAVAKAKKDGTTAITEKGEGAVITTYANFRQNKALLEDLFDLIVYDESHRLLENKEGAGTTGAQQHYKLSNRNEQYAFLRLQEINPTWNAYNAKYEEFNTRRDATIVRVKKESGTSNELTLGQRGELPPAFNGNWTGDMERKFPELAGLREETIALERKFRNEVKPELEQQAKESVKHTKVVFLSATPFNTRENLDYAEGYIFSYPEGEKQDGYSTQSPRSQFYLEHFGAGYKWRYHRLESSGSNPEALSKQEIEFSDYLQHTLQTMSGRIIDSPFDYSRDFPTVTLDKAEEFNNAMEELSRNKATSFAYYRVMGDYNYTGALFESMKVAQIIPRLKEHLARGRKAVIFHRRVESKNPLVPPFNAILGMAVNILNEEHDATKKEEKKKEIARLRRKYAGMLEWERTLDLRMPREQLAEAFGKGNVLFFSGKESDKAKKKAVEDFNDDNSGKNIIVIQEDSGKEGISLHDTTGNHQRVLVTLALPQSPITALQIEGRIYRIGNKSNAIFEYPLLGLNTELILFGQKFNQQVSTTENLALGSQARNLRESFARGVEEHSGNVDLDSQGVGGKEFDAPYVTETDAFDRAVLDYYTNQKLSGRRDDREGKDYYPTPEPLGFMMSQWGQIGDGESVLEPSAGHGAIARYVPRENLLTAIEPSQGLFSRLQVKAGGNGRRFENTIFENYNVVNKHDVVLMNPPFGTGGRLAVDHVAKAFQHLEEGGRIVAIIPRGSTDSKFDKWYNGQEDAVVSAEIGLPDITFERAGTSVNCRVVVIDKVTNDALRQNAAARAMHIDLSGHHYEKIEDFFDKLRDIRVPERTIDQKAKLKKKAAPVARELRGIKGINYVNLDDNGILVSGKGIYYNSLIAWDDNTGNNLIDYLAGRYKTFDNEYNYAVRRGNELREAVYGELRSLACKLAGMTEDEMQRYIDAKSGESVRFRMDDGTSAKEMEAVNRKFNEELSTLSEENADKVTFNLGTPSDILLAAGVANKPMKLYGSKVIKKMRKHGFELSELENLPAAIADPIGVFDNLGKTGNRSILTELKTKDGNFLVTIDLGKGNMDADFNIVSSIFGKSDNKVLNWLNKGLATYINKEKALNYLHLSAPIAEASNNQELSDATNVVESFENPKIPGENFDAVDVGSAVSRSEESVNHAHEERIMQAVSTLSEQLHVPVKAVRSVDELPANSEARHRIEQGRNVKAWFDPSTGEVTVYLPNAFDEADAVRSVLHETVGHRGLRELFGKEFDRAMTDIYRQLPEDVRREIAAAAAGRYNGNVSVAMDEYLAEQAEKDETPTWWEKVVSAIRALLRRMGIDVTLSDNDVKYLLWRSRSNLERGNVSQYAKDRVMRNKLGVERNRDAVLRESEYNKEEAEIIERAKREGTYMKAPNGEPTNLTPKQWVQVRTKAFKKWFGDWEKAVRIAKLRKSRPVEITGNEITPSDDLKQYKKNALEYGKSLRGEYTNKDTGEKIILSSGNKNGGLKEVLQHDITDIPHLQSVAAIPQIIENSVYIDSVENEDKEKNSNVSRYHYYVCGLKIGQTDYTVRAVIAEQPNGERYYDHKLTQIEKGKLLNELTFSTASSGLSSTGEQGDSEQSRPANGRRETLNSPVSNIKDKRLLSILQTNSSKVVDENGEPLVVYHGTPLSRSQITPDRGWHGDVFVRQEAPFHTFKGGEYSGLIFTSVDEDKARSIAEKRAMSIPDDEQGNERWTEEGYVYDLYLNLKNPFDPKDSNHVREILQSFGDEIPTLAFYGGKGNNVSLEEAVRMASSERNSWLVTETPEFLSKVRELGYDGLVGYDESVKYMAAFSPNQIKSATDNTGAFSSEDNDIRFRETRVDKGRLADAAHVRSEYEKRMTAGKFVLAEGFLDSMKALAEFHKLIEEKTGEKIRDYENAYYAENAMSSANLAQQEDFKRRCMTPIVETLSAFVSKGVEARTVSDWLITKHGIERNREMAVRKEIEVLAPAEAKRKLEEFEAEMADAGEEPLTRRQRAAKLRELENNARDKLFDLWNGMKKEVWEKGYAWTEQERILDDLAEKNFFADLGKDYSGLSSRYGDPVKEGSFRDEAMLFVENFEKANGPLCEEMLERVGAATREITDKQLEGGLMDIRTRERIGNMFRYYVPLRGWSEETTEDVYTYLTDGVHAFNAPLKKMHGRTSWPDDPLPTIANMGASGIAQANRNKMKQRFLTLVENHPTDLVSISEAYAQLDETTGEYVLALPSIPRDATPEEASGIMEDFRDRMAELADSDTSSVRRVSELGDIPYRVPSAREMNEHIVMVKRNGKNYQLTINGNPRLAQAVNGLTNPDSEATGGMNTFINLVKRFNRFMSLNFTSRNPTFVARNFVRDMMYANSILHVKESEGYAARYHLNWLRYNPKMMHGLILKYESGKLAPAGNETDRYFLEFMMNGGETGYTNLKRIDQIKKEMEKEVRDVNSTMTVRKGVRLLGKKLDLMNRSVEMCARFAAYVTSREAGRSVARSVWDAKEISVNFNKKGAGGKMTDREHNKWYVNGGLALASYLRNFYIFFNASIQGVANLARAAYHNKGKISALLGSTYALGMLAAMMGGDDDEDSYYNLPEYTRRNCICFYAGGKWVCLPLPHGLKTFYGLGELTMSEITGRERGDGWDFAKKAGELLSQLLPIDIYGEGGIAALVPSSLKPGYEVLNNKDWTGQPIYRKNSFNEDMPKWTKAYSSTATPYVLATKWLNELSGGDKYTKGGIDWNPAVIEHFVNGYLGGLSTFTSQLDNTVEMIWNKDKREMRNVPVLSGLVKDAGGRTKENRIRSEFFDNVEWMDGISNRLRGYRNEMEDAAKKGDTMRFAEYRVKLDALMKSDDYRKYVNMKRTKSAYDKFYEAYGKTPTEEQKAVLTEWMERLNDVAAEDYGKDKGDVKKAG